MNFCSSNELIIINDGLLNSRNLQNLSASSKVCNSASSNILIHFSLLKAIQSPHGLGCKGNGMSPGKPGAPSKSDKPGGPRKPGKPSEPGGP